MRTKWLFHRFNLLVITKSELMAFQWCFDVLGWSLFPLPLRATITSCIRRLRQLRHSRSFHCSCIKKNNLVRLWLVRCCNVFHFRTFISLRGESKVSVHYMVKGKQVSWSLIELQLLLKTKKRKRRQSLLICTACSFALSWLPLIR